MSTIGVLTISLPKPTAIHPTCRVDERRYSTDVPLTVAVTHILLPHFLSPSKPDADDDVEFVEGMVDVVGGGDVDGFSGGGP
jgi:hypothetical protein